MADGNNMFHGEKDLNVINEEIRLLSVKNPYAELFLHGKSLEVRSRNTNYRGWVLICSTQKPFTFAETLTISGVDQFAVLNQKLGHLIQSDGFNDLQNGYTRT